MLKIYPFIIETLRLIAPLVSEIARRDPDLARQLAASSIALNTAEAIGRQRRETNACGFAPHSDRLKKFVHASTLRRSSHHVETIDEVLRDRLDRIAATLYRLTS